MSNSNPRTKILMMLIKRMPRHSTGQPDGVACLFPWEPRVGRTVRPDVAADRVALRFPLFHDVGFDLQPSDLL